MIENKTLFERIASEWIKEFMHMQKNFEPLDILRIMPLQHLGITLRETDNDEIGKLTTVTNHEQFAILFSTVEGLIPTFAKQYNYMQDTDGKWKPVNTCINEAAVKSCAEIEQIEFDFSEGEKINVIESENYTYIEDETELVAPFENYVKKMRALLGADPDVTVVSDAMHKVINICVAGCDKPSAYRQFFPSSQFVKGVGDITILINNHKKTYKTKANINILKNMLANHPLVKEISVSRLRNGNINRIFVIFKNQTVQFKNDNFASLWSVTTTTAEDLARTVMKGSGMIIHWTTYSDMSYEKWTPETLPPTTNNI